MKRSVIVFIESKWHSLDVDNNEDYRIGDLLQFKKEDTLITFQSSEVTRYITSNKVIKEIPHIVDLECFDKQMSQVGKEFRNYKEWKVVRFLKQHNIIDINFEIKNSSFRLLLESIAKLYIKLLDESNEAERFEQIELPVNKILYERQSQGIKIDYDKIKNKCSEIERDIYKVKNILQLKYNIFSPDEEAQQIRYLESKKYKIIQSLSYSFKIRRDEDPVCDLFYNMIRNEQDLDSFLYMLAHWGGKQKTMPTYYGFGTITSRITLRKPALQNIRKSNRSVIVPEKGKKFIYLDYSQFEAGILASLSGDKALIDLYNSDIYSDIAEKVLRNNNKRTEAKTIFYRYMYGDESISENAMLYFQKFKRLQEYKNEIETTIKKNGMIGTKLGNYRLPSNDDYSWALSHIIQGTASLIYKNALLRTRKEIPSAEFLIPMHDGTLYQVDDSILSYHVQKKAIVDIYISEFEKMCPEINARVECKDNF